MGRVSEYEKQVENNPQLAYYDLRPGKVHRTTLLVAAEPDIPMAMTTKMDKAIDYANKSGTPIRKFVVTLPDLWFLWGLSLETPYYLQKTTDLSKNPVTLAIVNGRTNKLVGHINRAQSALLENDVTPSSKAFYMSHKGWLKKRVEFLIAVYE